MQVQPGKVLAVSSSLPAGEQKREGRPEAQGQGGAGKRGRQRGRARAPPQVERLHRAVRVPARDRAGL